MNVKTRQSFLPVMIFFHGGAYVEGSGSVYLPHKMVQRGVIVVTINYRLGALGFMSLGNEYISGNMGLKDMAMALKWMSEFIVYFGGDAKRVTIFGESAGNYHSILDSLVFRDHFVCFQVR